MCLAVKPREAGVLLGGLLPLDAPAAEDAGAVVDAPCHPDAEPVGTPAALPAGHDLQVVDPVHDPDKLLGLHEVEGDPAGDVLPLGDDAGGHVPYDRGLDQRGLDAVPVELLRCQAEVFHVPGQGVLLIHGEESVLQGAFYSGLPGPHQKVGLLAVVEAGLAEGGCEFFRRFRLVTTARALSLAPVAWRVR